MLETIATQLRLAAADAESLLKVCLMSRHRRKSLPTDKSRPLIIMGNGPGLRDALDNHGDVLGRYELMAVNFAANAAEFAALQPERYILADPHFFSGGDDNVVKMWENLRGVNSGMTLHVPAKYRQEAARLTAGSKITLDTFNLTPVEGHDALAHALFSAGLGMPRPRNVLIAAIMVAILSGYGTIYLAGADHSWSRTLWVDDENRVVSVQPHFYKDNRKELDRVAGEYAGYHLHDILHSLTVAFRSYFEIKRYAEKRGVEIYNVTPGSMIDAFPRKPLSSL